jgi:hypothetical protein
MVKLQAVLTPISSVHNSRSNSMILYLCYSMSPFFSFVREAGGRGQTPNWGNWVTCCVTLEVLLFSWKPYRDTPTTCLLVFKQHPPLVLIVALISFTDVLYILDCRDHSPCCSPTGCGQMPDWNFDQSRDLCQNLTFWHTVQYVKRV